jgi:4-amino-4-deoxy-L-arabinose transferase-like glycosyltransferase
MLKPRTFWIALALVTILRVLVAALLPLTLDEPYYWLWAHHLALGYYDHPPLMAWLSAPFVPLGNGPLAVRAAALLSSTASAALLYIYARRLTRNETASVAAALAFLAAPYFSVMAVLEWPEYALLVTWTWALLAWHSAVFAERPAPLAWINAGLALGACLLAKFTSFGFLFGLGLFFALSPRARARWLPTPWPWLALAIAALLYSPYLYWNAEHGWITFKFQAASRSEGGFHLHLEHLPNFIAETLGGLSPLVALGLVPAVGQGLVRAFTDGEGESARLPLAVSLPGLFGLFAMVPVAMVQVYWTLCLYLGLFPILGRWYADRLEASPPPWRRRGALALALGLGPLLLAATAVGFPQVLFDLAKGPRMEAGRPWGGGLTEMYGWPDLYDRLEAIRAGMPGRTFFAAEDHRLASHLQLLARDTPVAMFTIDKRGLEYLRFVDLSGLVGENCLMLLRDPFEVDRQRLRTGLQEAFDRVVPDPTPLVATWRGRPAQIFFIVRCSGFHPDRLPDRLQP